MLNIPFLRLGVSLHISLLYVPELPNIYNDDICSDASEDSEDGAPRRGRAKVSQWLSPRYPEIDLSRFDQPSDDGYFEMHMSNSNSPWDFSLTPFCRVPELDPINQQLAKYAQDAEEAMAAFGASSHGVTPDAMYHGMPVAARYEGQVYRAMVVEGPYGPVQALKCRVRFVDYGNTEEALVNDLLQLPPELMAISPIAMWCTLAHLARFHEAEMTALFAQIVQAMVNQDRGACLVKCKVVTMVDGRFSVSLRSPDDLDFLDAMKMD